MIELKFLRREGNVAVFLGPDGHERRAEVRIGFTGRPPYGVEAYFDDEYRWFIGVSSTPVVQPSAMLSLHGGDAALEERFEQLRASSVYYDEW